MKKLFLLLLAGVSLHAMENDDNDNNNNNNNDDKALIVKKNTDWIPGAAYYTMHNHTPGKNIMGKPKWGNCWRYYAIEEYDKIKAKKCPDFENPALGGPYRVVAFYAVNKELMLDHLQPIESESKRAREAVFKKEQNKLDPNAKPQATKGIIYESVPPATLVLFDKDNQIIFSYAGFFIDGGSKLKPNDKEIIERYVDVTLIDLTKIKTEIQIEKEKEQQKKEEKKRKKALEKALKKEKKS